MFTGWLPLCPGGLLLCDTTTAVVGSGSLLVSLDLSHGGQPHPTGARLQRKSYLVFVAFSTGVECAAVHCTVHLQLAWALVGLRNIIGLRLSRGVCIELGIDKKICLNPGVSENHAKLNNVTAPQRTN